MALSLALTDNRGIALTYHACTKIVWDDLGQTAMLQFDSWVSPATQAQYPLTPASDRTQLHQLVLSGADFTTFTDAIQTQGAKAVAAAEAVLVGKGVIDPDGDWFWSANWSQATAV